VTHFGGRGEGDGNCFFVFVPLNNVFKSGLRYVKMSTVIETSLENLSCIRIEFERISTNNMWEMVTFSLDNINSST
jgi:hypothetical protein